MDIYKAPYSLLRQLSNNTPLITISEDYGRGRGYNGGYDEDTSGYKAIIIYIQLGLSEYKDLIKGVVNLVLSIQSNYAKKYPLVVAAFGKGKEFIHDRKYFDLGYLNDRLTNNKISEVVIDLSNRGISDIPAIIPDFFPKTDNRSLYYGKIKFDRDDLMVIIGKKDEVFFDSELQERFRSWMKKNILFVEIDGDNINWNYKNFEIKFILNN